LTTSGNCQYKARKEDKRSKKRGNRNGLVRSRKRSGKLEIGDWSRCDLRSGNTKDVVVHWRRTREG
jgi:hypothetical protein